MTNKKQLLTEQEMEQFVVSAFERGELKSIPNEKEEIARITTLFKNSGNRIKRINIRLTEVDFEQAQVRAVREGLPYQSLLSSVIHKWLAGRLVEKLG